MKKYFILFLIMCLLNNCAFVKKNKDAIIGISILTIVTAPYPIYVAKVGVPGVTIGKAIAIGFAGGMAFLLLGIPLIFGSIECLGKSEDLTSFDLCLKEWGK